MEFWQRLALVVIPMFIGYSVISVMLMQEVSLNWQRWVAGGIGAVVGAAGAFAAIVDTRVAPAAVPFAGGFIVALTIAAHLGMLPMLRQIADSGNEMHGRGRFDRSDGDRKTDEV